MRVWAISILALGFAVALSVPGTAQQARPPGYSQGVPGAADDDETETAPAGPSGGLKPLPSPAAQAPTCTTEMKPDPNCSATGIRAFKVCYVNKKVVSQSRLQCT